MPSHSAAREFRHREAQRRSPERPADVRALPRVALQASNESVECGGGDKVVGRRMRWPREARVATRTPRRRLPQRNIAPPDARRTG